MTKKKAAITNDKSAASLTVEQDTSQIDREASVVSDSNRPGLLERLPRLENIGSIIKTTWLAGLTLLVLGFLFSVGIFDVLLPSTPGFIRVESPQIYTRERLVNDRFREQAWLEQQLDSVEKKQQLISSIQSTSMQLAVRGKNADGINPTDQPTTSETIEKDLSRLIRATDAFEKQRSIRSTIRRALIENELDDRHDLGSNSLYQLNFGATVVAGPRTRGIVAIEMEIEPETPLKPLSDEINNENSQCHNLLQFECGYLINEGYLIPRIDEEKTIRREYQAWNDLFNRWIALENSNYDRETEGIRDLLQSVEANSQLETALGPFFVQLRDKNNFARNLIREYANAENNPHFEACDFLPPKNLSGTFEEEFRKVLKNCIKFINYYFDKRLLDEKRIAGYLASDVGISYFNDYKAGDPQFEGTAFNQFFQDVFGKFNKQCAWGGQMIRPIGVGVGESNDSSPRYRIKEEVEQRLLTCIYNAIIRDYGSHPFSRVIREENSASGSESGLQSGRRSTVSTYTSFGGLSDVIATDPSVRSRFAGRFAFVGTIQNEDTSAEKNRPYEVAPAELVASEEKCRALTVGNGKNRHNGMTGGYLKYQTSNSTVEPSLGWAFMLKLICQKLTKNQLALRSETQVDAQFLIPVGLFKFIYTLSNKQRTFSYSVQPSGAFDLEQQSNSQSLSLRNLLADPAFKLSLDGQQQNVSQRVARKYRIIGFGGQAEGRSGTVSKPDTNGATKGMMKFDRRANFGWYIFPETKNSGMFSTPVMESANVKLAALVSLPAWWESVRIRVSRKWLNPNKLPAVRQLNAKSDDDLFLKVDLPTRLEFIRNHFPDASSIRPTLYQLQIPKVTLRACEDASIILKGERLWRSTVVTLGNQKSKLIEVMPNMGGIIAHFERVQPTQFGRAENGIYSSGKRNFYKLPVTIWTSEGEKTVVDSVEVQLPRAMMNRRNKGGQLCEDEKAVEPAKTTAEVRELQSQEDTPTAR